MPGGDDKHEDPVVSQETPQGRTVLLRDLPDGLAVASRSSGPDRGLERVEIVRGHLPGDRYVRLSRNRDFRRVRPGYLVPRETNLPNGSRATQFLGAFRRLVLGRPLATAAEVEERVNRLIGLAIFAWDNISPSAYATEEIMCVLVLAGIGALALTLPITLVICVVLAIVVISYRQVILAYPNGGGSYVVAKENLGALAGLAAGAALLIDYVLTVSVSTAAGVAALTSAFPELFARRVAIMLVVVAFMMLINLRGIRESGRAFAVPTYIYVVSILGLVGYGIFRFVTGNLPHYDPPPEWLASEGAGFEAVGLLLILRAFASGSVALTGTEAVANGVPAFKAPSVSNAQTVLLWMGALFATIFISISFLAGRLGIIPDPSEAQTVVSQLARTLVSDGAYFVVIQFSTAVLLVLAANTSFNGFPRLASIMSTDRFLPRVFRFRGERLAFTGGIIVLAIVSGLLIVAYNGSVTGLIPLYTVGVFIAFTLSQAGMVKHWYQSRAEDRHWQLRAAVNALGAFTTGVVTLEVAICKFVLGAWMVLALIPILIAMMWGIRKHYLRMDSALRPETPLDPADVRLRAIVPIGGFNIPARQALAFARAMVPDRAVTAVHITDDPVAMESLQSEWRRSSKGATNLVVIESPYRSLAGPLLRYIDAVHDIYPEDTLVVVLPEYVPSHWWEQLIHNQTALRLKTALLFHPGVIVADVPYHLAP